MAATMKNTEYQVGKIMSFDRMQSYLSRADVQENILELIPSNKKQWKYEFFELIAGEKRINNKPIPQQLELFI